MKRPVEIHDTSLRDSIGDFVTLHMKSGELTEVLSILDRAGFSSIDCFGGMIFMPTMTILGEDPWQRLRALRKAVRHTPVQAVVRGRMLFGRWIAPDSTIKATIAQIRNCGVDRLKVTDSGLDLDGAAKVIGYAKDLGMHVTASVPLSWGELPWLDEMLERSATVFQAAGADDMSLQDPYGLMTPATTARAVKKHCSRFSLPLKLHLHDVNLLAVASLEAGLNAGAVGADTTVSTLAWSYSPAQTESVVMCLRGTERDPGVDLLVVEEAATWFERAKAAKGFKYHAVYGVDHDQLRGHMPVAVRRALADTLREVSRMDLMERCWPEVPRVWEALGKPPLFSPLVQAICAQALENVASGLPWAKLDYRVASYLRGEFGKVLPGVRSDLVAKANGDKTVFAAKSRPLDVNNLAPDAYPSEDDRITYANFPTHGDEFFKTRTKLRANLPDTRFVAREQTHAQPSIMPRRLVVNRHGETFEVALEGMGPLENGKRTLFLRIGGETAKIEVTFPPEGGAPSYKLLHHGKNHSFEFVHVLPAGSKNLPVIIRENGKEEEILYSFPRS